MLTQEYLKTVLNYNKDTGVFTWVKTMNSRAVINSVAGTLSKGYVKININSKRYAAHRLAWFYVYNQWPNNQIDHINCIKHDNKIENLRIVTQRENHQNRARHRLGKLVGCSYDKKSNKWISSIRIKTKANYLGSFDTEQEAHDRYLKEVVKYD